MQDARRIKALSQGFPAAVQRNGRCVVDIRLPKVYSICDPVWGWRGVVAYHVLLRHMQATARRVQQEHAAAATAAEQQRIADPEVQALADFADSPRQRNEHNPFIQDQSSAAVSAPEAFGTARAGAPRVLSQAEAAVRHRQQPQIDLSYEAHAHNLHSPVNKCTLACFMACPCVWWAPIPDPNACLAFSLGGCQRTLNTCSFWMGGLSSVLFVLACILDDSVVASMRGEAQPAEADIEYDQPSFAEAMVGLPAIGVQRIGAFYASPGTDGGVDGIFRLLTALLVPGSMVHLLMHLAVLWRAGPVLEYLWGSPRFLLVYLGGGLMGMLFEAAVLREDYANSEETICAVGFGDVSMLAMWALYLLMEGSVQHKLHRSGSWLMFGLLLYCALITGVTFAFPLTGSGLGALGAAVLFAPPMYVVAFNNLNTKHRVTFGKHDEVWLRSEVGPGLHLMVPDGTRTIVRSARRGDRARDLDREASAGPEDTASNATSGENDAAQSAQLATPLVSRQEADELPRGSGSTRRWARLMRARQKAPLCEGCVFVCPASVRCCGCRRVWGVPTVCASLLLLACFVTFLCIALGA